MGFESPRSPEEVTCPDCNGTGHVDENGKKVKCKKCNGTGIKPVGG